MGAASPLEPELASLACPRTSASSFASSSSQLGLVNRKYGMVNDGTVNQSEVWRVHVPTLVRTFATCWRERRPRVSECGRRTCDLPEHAQKFLWRYHSQILGDLEDGGCGLDSYGFKAEQLTMVGSGKAVVESGSFNLRAVSGRVHTRLLALYHSPCWRFCLGLRLAVLAHPTAG